MSDGRGRTVAVVGAGVLGAAIALALAEDGHDVTLLDPYGADRAAVGAMREAAT